MGAVVGWVRLLILLIIGMLFIAILISAISMFSIIVIGIPFLAVIVLVVFLIRKSKSKKSDVSTCDVP